MQYGFEVRRENGSIMYNGLSKGRVLMGVLRCPAGQSGKAYYPGTLQADLAINMARSGAHYITTGNEVGPNGSMQGFVQWAWRDWGQQLETVVFVFAKKRIDASSYGIVIVNEAGEQLADQGYPSPQWAGTVYCETNARLSYTTPDSYVASVHRATVNVRPGADQLVVAYLPDSGTDDTWYYVSREAIFASEGSVDVDVIVYTKAQSYKLPSLHLFAVNSIRSSPDAYGAQIRTEDLMLTFDATAEGMGIVDTTAITFHTDSNAMVPIQALGVGNTVPYFEITGTYADQNDYRILGCYKKVGSQLMTQAITDSKRPRTGVTPYTIGGTDLREVLEVDVSQLNPYHFVGTPAPFSSAPVFTTNPQTIPGYTKPGTSVTFSVEVVGSPTPALQWCKFDNNQTFMEIPGETNKTYTFAAQMSDNGDVFFCHARNTLGDTNSGQAFVNVSDFNPAKLVSYSLSPTTVNVGDTVYVSMTSSGDAPVTCTITGPRGTIATGTGSAGGSFVATTDDQGYYGFIVHNVSSYGEQGGDQRSLNLVVNGALPPRITSQPGDVVTTLGASASVTCVAEPAGVEYYWYKQSGSSFEFFGIGSTIPVDTNITGIFGYYCQVRTGPDNYVYSRTAQVTVNGGGGGGGGGGTPDPQPTFSQQPPSDYYATAGDSVSLTCQASPTTSFQWYQNGARMSGETSNSLNIGVVNTGLDLVQYYCDAINGTASRSSTTTTLHVAAAQAPTTYPSYNYPLDDSVYDYQGVSWGAYDNWTDSGYWANGAGDSSLYDIMGILQNGVATGDSFNAWHSMSSGVSWTCTATTKVSRSAQIYWQIRHRSSGTVVSYGTLQMDAYNGAIQ